MSEYLILDAMPQYCYSSYIQPKEGEPLCGQHSPYDVLFLCMSGETRFSCGSCERTLSAGQWYVYHASAQTPVCRRFEGCQLYAIYFQGQFGDATQSVLPLWGDFPMRAVTPLVEQLAALAKNPVTPRFLLICDFFTLCAELMCAVPPARHKAVAISEIHSYLRSHFVEDVDISALAAEYGYSADYLSRKYQKAYGMTPSSHIRSLRIQYACRLLISPGATVQSVSDACGYSDYSTFYRAFLACIGESPNQWMEKMRK